MGVLKKFDASETDNADTPLSESESESADGKVVPTLGQIRAAIPKECFQHSTARAFWLLLRDGLVIASLFFAATRILRTPGLSDEPLTPFDWAGWFIYSFAQGSALTGWWVLAHECGHGGFSASKLLNDTVGWVLHSFLLVPYFSWQYSHSKHHSNTNHLIKGETHVPDTREELEKVGFAWMHDTFGEDFFAVFQLIGHLVVGWPAYLLFNVTGGRQLKGASLQKPVPFPDIVDHFRPWSALFPKHWAFKIVLADIGIGLTLWVLAMASKKFGFAAVAVHYIAPYLWVNFWLVLYTWLHHTDPAVPQYGDDTFTWLKGALCTIDRPYGVFDWMHHDIGSTHVCHHVFSTLPCYNAVEATKHLKAFLEPRGLYNYDATFWPLAAWRVAKTCHYVENVTGTQYYKSLKSSRVKDKSQGTPQGKRLQANQGGEGSKKLKRS
jgi:omega-6 fatty acid desaturase (delta-12 desaturase)